MRIAYLTTDEVNHDLACRIAEACGAILEVASLAELTQEGRYDGVLLDWDYLMRERGYPILVDLLTGRRRCPLAVHGYRLEDDWQKTLSRNGVTIHRHLEPNWLSRWLRRVAPDACPRPL